MRLAVAFITLSAAFLSANAALVARQTLPSCAVTCITNANTGGCASTDDSCLCNNQTFVSTTTSCIESSCSGNDLVEAEQYAQAICAAVGVTLTAPVPSSTATSPSSSSSTSTSSASASTATHTSGASLSYGINVFAGAAAAAVAFGAAL
ncbi:hypothetical protein V8B97DRAFT_1915696 [Scleroderma yunnanense]